MPMRVLSFLFPRYARPRNAPALRLAALTVVLTLAASPLHAGAATESPAPAPPPASVTPGTTFAWAAAGTLLPIATGATLIALSDAEAVEYPALGLLAFGFTLGPSLGQFRQGSVGHGLLAAGLRSVGGTLFIVGLSSDIGKSINGCDDPSYGDCDSSSERGMWVGGMLLYAGGLVYSLIQGHIASLSSQAHAAAPVEVDPILGPGPDGALLAGLTARIRF